MDELSTEPKSVSSEIARHIARVAAKLFASRGYDATSVREIVEAAGVTKPTLYYHFGSKEGLAQALLTVPMAGLIARLRKALHSGSDPVATLADHFDAHFDFFREDPDRGLFFFALFFGPLEPSLANELAGFGKQIKECLRESIEQLVEAGILDPARVGRFATACWGVIVVKAMDILYKSGECGPHAIQGWPEDQSITIVNDLIQGFGAPS
jgi:TetR/AcrR family transcriptional regulator